MQKEKYQRNLYWVGEGTYKLIEQAEAICKREKVSFNQLARNALEEYVARHGDQNKNFTLDKFGVTWTRAVAVGTCGFRGCGELAVGSGLFVPRKQVFGLCRAHFLAAQKNPKVWTNLKSGVV